MTSETVEISKEKLTKIICELGEASMRVDECVAELEEIRGKENGRGERVS